MNSSFFIGNQVRLRAVEPEDLEILYTMENDPELWDISNFSVPYSRYMLRQYIEQCQSDLFADQQLRLMIVRVEDDVVLGTIDLMNFSAMHQRGEVGIALQHQYQGKGYASEALRLLIQYAFDFLNMKQLNAHVLISNESSYKLFCSCGFCSCGVLKSWWRIGNKYEDVHILQLLRCDKEEK